MIRQWNRFVEDPACDQLSTERYAQGHMRMELFACRANLRSCSISRGPGEAPAIATATNTVSDALKRMAYPERKATGDCFGRPGDASERSRAMARNLSFSE